MTPRKAKGEHPILGAAAESEFECKQNFNPKMGTGMPRVNVINVKVT